MSQRRRLAAFALLLAGCAQPEADVGESPVFIIGQDLDSIRGYLASGCCPAPDGLTAYLSFYDLLSDARGYGGIGLDAHGSPIDLEHSWGAGPVNAHATAAAFDVPHLAIGLDLGAGDRRASLDRLIAGEYDANVDQLLRLFRHVRGTVYLRIGYEFDGHWNTDYRDPVRFVAAFRYLVDRIRASGAGNVEFVWQASASPFDDLLDGRHEDIGAWYPGDRYVDWMAFSWFLHPQARPTSDALLRTAYAAATGRRGPGTGTSRGQARDDRGSGAARLRSREFNEAIHRRQLGRNGRGRPASLRR